jgi:S1-C subfamily serine protease
MTKRTLLIGLAVCAILLTLGLGAAAGAALTYAALRPAPSVQAAASATSDDEPGLLVAHVAPDSPAARAGVVRGDILLQVNGDAVADLRALRNKLRELKAGDQVELTVQHGDDQRTLTVTLGERDAQAFFGILPCEAHPGGLIFGDVPFLLEHGGGNVIMEVVAGGPAEKAGLKIGDRVVSVDGQALSPDYTLADAIAAHKPGDTVTLEVERTSEAARDVTVTLGEKPDDKGQAYLGVRFGPAPFAFRLEKGDIPFGDKIFPPDMPDDLPRGLPFDPGLEFTLPEGVQQALRIGAVTPDGPAAKAGLKEGALITAIEGQPVTHPRALAEAVAARKPGDSLALTVYPAGEAEARTVTITLGERPNDSGKAFLGVSINGFMITRESPNDLPQPELEFPRVPEFGEDV